jgi:hypothetical protein
MHTSVLESFHSLKCKYVPKDLPFRKCYETRIRMAVLDWNENSDRLVKKDKHGAESIAFAHPPAAGSWRARKMRENRTYRWCDDIMKNLGKSATTLWKGGSKIRKSKPISTFLPLVSTFEPLDKIGVAAALHRN